LYVAPKNKQLASCLIYAPKLASAVN